MKKAWRNLFAALLLFPAACARYDEHLGILPPEVIEQIKAFEKLPPKTAAEKEEIITIGTIRVLNLTVLHPDDFFAPLLNNLHFVTQKDTIVDELNFKSGDKIYRWELYDGERYIRMLDPIKQAKVLPTLNPETGKTDLTIVTQDKLSAYVRGGGAGTGGYSTFGIQAGETSLFGRLYSIGATYSRENFRDFIGLSAGKQRIGGTRWEVGVGSVEGFSDSMHNYASRGAFVAHPFTIDGQRHAFSLSVSFSQGVLYDYLGGGIRKGQDLVNARSFDLIYRNSTENISAMYMHGIGKKHRIEFGPGFQQYISRDYYIFSQDQYQISHSREVPVSAAARAYYLPEQFSTRALSFTVNTRNGDFTSMTNFRRYLFTEDQFEGLRTSTGVVHANPAFGLADHYTKPTISVTYQKNFLDKKLRLETSAGRTATFWLNRYEIPRDDSWSLDGRVFYFTGYGTIAWRNYASAGNNMSAAARGTIAGQFTRGFFYGSVTPSAGYLSSLEYRSPGLKLPYILLAGVVFFDYAGTGTNMGTLDWYPVVGAGLRSMLHEFDNNVFRFDVGVNLREQNFDLLNAIQFGMSHSF